MKVLLIGDVGGFPLGFKKLILPKYYYHVGDEAMFLEVIRWYKLNDSDYQLLAFSWSKNYKHLGISTTYHFVWPNKKIINCLYLGIFVFKLLFYKYLKIKILYAEKTSRYEISLSKSNPKICINNLLHAFKEIINKLEAEKSILIKKTNDYLPKIY